MPRVRRSLYNQCHLRRGHTRPLVRHRRSRRPTHSGSCRSNGRRCSLAAAETAMAAAAAAAAAAAVARARAVAVAAAAVARVRVAAGCTHMHTAFAGHSRGNQSRAYRAHTQSRLLHHRSRRHCCECRCLSTPSAMEPPVRVPAAAVPVAMVEELAEEVLSATAAAAAAAVRASQQDVGHSRRNRFHSHRSYTRSLARHPAGS